MTTAASQGISFQPVDRVETISRREFQAKYLQPERPVVIETLADDWPARSKWTPEFFQEVHGHRQVKVYDSSFADPGATYMSSLRTISLRDYVEQVIHQDGDLRMFLYNMVREAPELQDDIVFPDLADGFSRMFIFMFFGCTGSVTPIHYDIDMTHVFHTPLYGRKRVVLFSRDQSRRLYRHPFTVRSYVNVDEPDYERFPALATAEGYEAVLDAGETIFIPSGYWHHIVYQKGGYSVSLRCRHDRLTRRLEGLGNLITSTLIDRVMNKLFSKRWFAWKERAADRRALPFVHGSAGWQDHRGTG
jgi:hypothetical protein